MDDRCGFTENILPIIRHPVPPKAKWSYVFGSATLFCFILQVVTGIALSLFYQPSSGQAYHSLEFITHQAKFGNVLRGIHYFGASTMIILVGIHMIRVYIMASYKFPREMNWISGIILLLCTIFMGFTGQLLRWDSNGVWSSVVAAEQLGRIPLVGKYLARMLLGGDTLGGQSLSRFYSYHVFLVPAIIFIFTGFHLYLVIHNGISEPPKAGRYIDPRTYRMWYRNMLKEKGVPFWPNAAWRDVMFSSIVILCIICLAVIFGPPELSGKPDPAVLTTTPKPDWYMVPFYALFALMPHKIESVGMLLGPILTLAILFSAPFIANKGERSPLKRPWAMLGVITVMVCIISLLMIGIRAPWSPHFDTDPLPVSIVRSANPDPDVVQGVHLFYAKGCQYCHKIDKYGGIVGPDLTTIGKRLNNRELKIRIVNGGKEMPAFGGILSKDEIDKIVSFLATRK